MSFSSFAQQPTGFQDELKVQGNHSSSLSNLVGVSFDRTGKMYAFETNGKVWTIRFSENNVEQRFLLLDISNEVLNTGDLGLVSMVLDPNFLQNGFFYVMYSVNRDFLLTGIDGGDDASQSGTIARVTRYTADVSTNFTTLVVDSRLILVGDLPSDGIPILGPNHVGGCMVFGSDKSLLVCTGDGAVVGIDEGNNGYVTEALASGVITQAQNVGAYRSQMNNSLNGKVLRINPLNGHGYPSNPHYDINNPKAAQSRMWAKGFRNPFRMTLMPSTGGPHTEDGNPGIIVVGDVGGYQREEINTVTSADQNFGWPHYEGIDSINEYFDDSTFIPETYRKPIFEYRQDMSQANVFLNQTTKKQLGTQANDFYYNGLDIFSGGTIMIGEFYQGSSFPSKYQNALFFADYSSKWIRAMTFDSNYEPATIEDFMQLSDPLVGVTFNRTEDAIYYVSGNTFPCDQAHKITYSADSPPVAKITMDTNSGIAPLAVAFSAIKSFDPDNTSLVYQWSIDDVVFSNGLAPHFVFTPSQNIPQNYKVKLKVTDMNGMGASAIDSVTIYANNIPPVIHSTSIDGLNFMTANQNYYINLNAVVSDNQTATSDLQLSWTITFAHNGHEHKETPLDGNNINTTLGATGCEVGVATYWYKIYLKVIDSQGLSSTYLKEIQIDCAGDLQVISFPIIPSQEITLNLLNNITVSASSSVGSTPISFFITSGSATISGNTLTLTGKPGKVRIKAVQHGNGSYKPALPVEQTFDVDRAMVHHTVNFDSIPNKLVSALPFTIFASIPFNTDKIPSYLLISGPATVSGNTVTLTGQTGLVKIRAYYEGNYLSKGAYFDRTFNVNSPVTTDEIIYGDALKASWQNFSTISSLNISNTSSKFINTRSIKVTNPMVDKALDFRYNGFPIDTIGYPDGFEFWVYNDGSTSFPLRVQLFSTNSGTVAGNNLLVFADAHKWTHFLFDWAIIGTLTQVGKISIKLGQTQTESLYFDEIKLVHCADMHSIASGNWNQSTTWSCGRIPISTDYITISGGHTVTIPNGVSATLNFLQLIGTLNVQTGGIFDIKNY